MAASGANNIEISPVNCLWQMEAAEQLDLTGITAVSLDGKFLNISTAKDAILNYIWFDLDASGTDPTPAGRVAIEVDVVTGDTPAAMATLVAAALDALPGYEATATDAVVDIKRASVGTVTDTVDVDSLVAVTICRRGKDYNLGILEGDVELSMSPANFIVQAHQTGVTPRAALFQGIETLEVSTSMLETQTSQLSEIYGLYGSTGFVPAAGTSVYGAGTSKQGQNLLVDAARLVLKPVNASDDLGNVNLMLAIPIPDSLVFSGENPRSLGVTWQGFADETIDTRVSALLVGDAAQAGLAI